MVDQLDLFRADPPCSAAGANAVPAVPAEPRCVCGHPARFHDPRCIYPGCDCPRWNPPPASPVMPPRRFLAVSPERELQLLQEGRRMTRDQAERILRRL